MNVIPSQFDLLARSMQAAKLRHKIIAHNVANVDTPGYRALVVGFEDQLRQRLADARAAPKPPVVSEPDLSEVAARVDYDKSQYFRVDRNNVDISTEMGRLSKNSLLHNTYVQIMNAKMNAMRTAITGTG